MKEKIKNELEDIERLIKKDKTYLEAKSLREKLLSNKNLMQRVKDIQAEENIYNEDYRKKKRILYENEDYEKYQKLETKLYFMTLEINKILNRLTTKGRCGR